MREKIANGTVSGHGGECMSTQTSNFRLFNVLRNKLQQKIYILTCIFSVLLCLIILTPTYAFNLKPGTEEIQEAIEYGQKNKNTDIVRFSKQWSVFLGKGKGSAILFTPYYNIAYKARKAAVEHREFTDKDVQEALGIGDALTFTVTVYGEEYDFAMRYTAKLYQKDEVIQPEFEFVPQIADASEFWPNSPGNFARLVFKFPIKEIDSNAPVTLAVVIPGGDEIGFNFNLSDIK